MSEPHHCDDECVCPVHGTPLLWWPAGRQHACQNVDCKFGHGLERVEHAELYRGGNMHVLIDDPAIERIYPMADRVAHALRHSGQVYRRRVRVVEDWEPVEYGGQRCSNADCRTCQYEPRRSREE